MSRNLAPPAIVAFIVFFAALAPLDRSVQLMAQQVGAWSLADSSWVSRGHMEAADSLHFVITERWNSREQPYIAHRVVRSIDAGRTWAPVLVQPTDNFSFVDVAHPSPSSIVVIAQRDTTEDLPNGGWMWYGVEWQTIVTTDGGITWTSDTTRRRIVDVNMVNASLGYRLVGGVRDTVEITTNGGRDWTFWASPDLEWEESIIDGGDGEVRLLHYDTTERANRIVRTTDAGVTWVESPPLPAGGQSVAFTDAMNGVCVGGYIAKTYRDMIHRTTDGGQTWVLVYDQKFNSSGLRGVRYADRDNALAYGYGWMLYRTRDAGRSWSPEPIPYNVGLYPSIVDLAYPRASTAIAIEGSLYTLRFDGTLNLAPPHIIEPSANLSQHSAIVTYEWTPVEGATSYQLQVVDKNLSADTYDPEIYNYPDYNDSLLTTTSRSYTFEYNRRIDARVRAMNATQTSDWSRDHFLITKATASTLQRPYFTSPGYEAETGTTVDFAWTNVTDATSYDFVVASNRSMNPAIRRDTGFVGTSMTVSGLRANTYHYAAVRANAPGRVSEWTNVPFITTLPAGIDDVWSATKALSVTISPNPVRRGEPMSINITSARSLRADIDVFSITGSRTTHHIVHNIGAGVESLVVSFPDLSPGAHFVRVQAGSEIVTVPVVIQ